MVYRRGLPAGKAPFLIGKLKMKFRFHTESRLKSCCQQAGILIACLFIVFMLNRCTDHTTGSDDFTKWLPASIPDTVYLDPSNVYTRHKRELGRYLFYDNRLSVNNTRSCSSCHAQTFSFTDSYTRSSGAMGDLHQRNSRPLINLVYNRYLTAADSTLHFPETQMDGPLFNEHPPEMGARGHEQQIMDRLKNDSIYIALYAKAYPGEKDPVNWKNSKLAIATFIKTIISSDAPYDRYRRDSIQYPLPAPAIRGRQLFFSGKLKCYQCHGGNDFSTPLQNVQQRQPDFYFNTGLYNIDGKGGYPSYDRGLIDLTGKKEDEGKYRVPVLRNLLFTAPYYHDGSALTLEEVIRGYEQGGRIVKNGPFAGDGRINPFKSPLVSGFSLTDTERRDLISFLYSLSDSVLINNKNYANPYR